MQDNILFCLPLQEGRLEAFKEFSEHCQQEKIEQWLDMLARYDMSSVKTWYKMIEGRDYIFVYHDIGPTFPEKIQGWNDSSHPFDQWFNEQLMSLYATDAASDPAEGLAQLYVKSRK